MGQITKERIPDKTQAKRHYFLQALFPRCCSSRQFSLLIFLASIMLSPAAWAQTRLGLKVGFNVSNARWSSVSPLLKPIIKAGLHGGVFMEIPVEEKVIFKSELLMSMKGWTTPSINRDSLAPVKNGSVNLLYLSVPVLAGYRFSQRTALLGGVEMSLLRRSRIIPDGAPVFTNSYHTFDIGLALGWEFRVNEKLFMEARYVYGLSALAEVRNQKGVLVRDGYNRVLQLSLGYVLHQSRE